MFGQIISHLVSAQALDDARDLSMETISSAGLIGRYQQEAESTYAQVGQWGESDIYSKR
jgi:hypothetical protein